MVNDAEHRTSNEVDVVVLGEQDGAARKVLSLGEVKWVETMGTGHLDRLGRVRDLLAKRGYDTRGTRLACYSAAGFSADLARTANENHTLLVDLDRIYTGS